MTVPDIGPVIDLALLYNDKLAFADMQTVRLWVNDGMDVDKDILPAMKAVIDRRHQGRQVDRVNKFSYFTNAIRDHHDRRMAEDRKQQRENPVHDADSLRRKAERIAWVVRKAQGIKRPDLERWLEEYEHQHGKVTV